MEAGRTMSAPFDTGVTSSASPAVLSLADDMSRRTDGGSRRALWPHGRNYDGQTDRTGVVS